jgi:uncharacterized membrane protein (UPF0127 family)
MKNIKVGFKGKKFNIEARELSLPGQFIGLMFKSRETDSLLFNRGGRWSIHSFFVFFPFLALWLDEKNNVVEYKIVRPFTSYVQPKDKFAKLVEIPINEKNNKIIEAFEKWTAKR